MPPREATGTFPDQFLTFDYDVSVNLGGPPQHEPFPVVVQNNPNDNNLLGGEDDHNNINNPAAQQQLQETLNHHPLTGGRNTKQ